MTEESNPLYEIYDAADGRLVAAALIQASHLSDFSRIVGREIRSSEDKLVLRSDLPQFSRLVLRRNGRRSASITSCRLLPWQTPPTRCSTIGVCEPKHHCG